MQSEVMSTVAVMLCLLTGREMAIKRNWLSIDLPVAVEFSTGYDVL
jgi:hypothetical protein